MFKLMGGKKKQREGMSSLLCTPISSMGDNSILIMLVLMNCIPFQSSKLF